MFYNCILLCVCVQVMLNAAPSFLNVFHRLLASVMHEGRQRGDSDTGNTYRFRQVEKQLLAWRETLQFCLCKGCVCVLGELST